MKLMYPCVCNAMNSNRLIAHSIVSVYSGCGLYCEYLQKSLNLAEHANRGIYANKGEKSMQPLSRMQ